MEIIVTPVGRFWAVTHGDKVYSKREHKEVALADALKAAAEVASTEGRTIVLIEDGDDERAKLVWDSTRQGVSKPESR